MKFLIQISFILIVFFKTGNLLSDNNLFSVNNILLEKKDNISINRLANQAIKKAFNHLTARLLPAGILWTQQRRLPAPGDREHEARLCRPQSLPWRPGPDRDSHRRVDQQRLRRETPGADHRQSSQDGG